MKKGANTINYYLQISQLYLYWSAWLFLAVVVWIVEIARRGRQTAVRPISEMPFIGIQRVNHN
jgi:hypothetical protein